MKNVCFIVLILSLSCKTAMTQIEGDKLLIPLKIGFSPDGKDTNFDRYKLRFTNTSSSNEENVYINGIKVVGINKKLDQNFLFEIFDKNFLVISQYSNLSAASVEQMNRSNMYFVKLDNPNEILKLNSKSINLTIEKSLLDRFKKSSLESKIFAINYLESESIFLIGVNNNLKELKLHKMSIGSIIN